MATIAELKAQTQALIEARSAWLIDIAKTILAHPEAGFQEVNTARLVSEKLHELGIAHDTGLAKSGHSPTEFSIGHNVASEQEVDAVMEQAARAGARIVKKAQKTFWGGYAGYFQDPDGHIWELVYMDPNVVQQG